MRVAKKYNDEDFATLGWHDCRVYRISIPDEDSYLGLDIDYIFNFEKEDGNYTGFWVSPCKLVFAGINSLKVSLEFQNTALLFINEVTRANARLSPNGTVQLWDYRVELDKGLIEFTSSGFTQTTIKQPVLSGSYDLGR